MSQTPALLVCMLPQESDPECRLPFSTLGWDQGACNPVFQGLQIPQASHFRAVFGIERLADYIRGLWSRLCRYAYHASGTMIRQDRLRCFQAHKNGTAFGLPPAKGIRFSTERVQPGILTMSCRRSGNMGSAPNSHSPFDRARVFLKRRQEAKVSLDLEPGSARRSHDETLSAAISRAWISLPTAARQTGWPSWMENAQTIGYLQMRC